MALFFSNEPNFGLKGGVFALWQFTSFVSDNVASKSPTDGVLIKSKVRDVFNFYYSQVQWKHFDQRIQVISKSKSDRRYEGWV